MKWKTYSDVISTKYGNKIYEIDLIYFGWRRVRYDKISPDGWWSSDVHRTRFETENIDNTSVPPEGSVVV